MEALPHILIFLIFFIATFSSFILPSASYSVPEIYFINCGSSQTTSVNGHNFVGDVIPGNSFRFSGSGSNAVSEPNPTSSLPLLYQTSRVITQTSYYELDIDQSGIYILRLHFYPLVDSYQSIFNASFNVSASSGELPLLSKFNVGTNTTLPDIHEFFVSLKVGMFRITFEPLQESSLAFITAIEVFLAPDNFITDPTTYVSSSGEEESQLSGFLSGSLQVIHRINVGGKTLAGFSNDTLGRNWIPDDPFLLFNNISQPVERPGSPLSYLPQGATEYNAPNQVYNSARELDGLDSYLFNITWKFEVSKNASHLVRVHFCDIISNTSNENAFNLYIYTSYKMSIRPSDRVYKLAAPFFIDFAVESDDSGLMRIGVGHDQTRQPAFLNGVEIMELKGGSRPDSKSKNPSIIIVAAVIGGSIVIIVLVAVLIFVLRRGKPGPHDQLAESQLIGVNGGLSHLESTHRTSNHSLHDLNLDLRLSFSAIKRATKNFNPKFIIGEGGFGKVYSGILGGKKVAVKRSETGYGQGLSEFHTEINVLSKLRHRHLVSLIGYCDEGPEMILVYEFMGKGTLREHLYKMVNDGPGNCHKPESELSWEKRLEICIGAANGLHYLHACLDGSIIHRDVKSTNILLDEDYTAKVSDFGLSKLGLPDQTHVSTGVKGSFGYYDPEYLQCAQLTQKSDVYSFGVVLVEVLCARPVINVSLPAEQVNLPQWALEQLKKGLLETIIDPFLVGKINPNSLRKYGEIFQKCLEENSTDRPNMLDVSWSLEFALRLQRPNRIMSGQNGDTITDVSINLPSMLINRLPSYSTPFTDIDLPQGSEDMESNYTDASQVFSQLKMDEAR